MYIHEAKLFGYTYNILIQYTWGDEWPLTYKYMLYLHISLIKHLMEIDLERHSYWHRHPITFTIYNEKQMIGPISRLCNKKKTERKQKLVNRVVQNIISRF